MPLIDGEAVTFVWEGQTAPLLLASMGGVMSLYTGLETLFPPIKP